MGEEGAADLDLARDLRAERERKRFRPRGLRVGDGMGGTGMVLMSSERLGRRGSAMLAEMGVFGSCRKTEV